MNVREFYEKILADRGYQSDPAQLMAVDRLQRAYDEWADYLSRRSSRLRRMLLHPDLPRGMYLWGGVGRGKSFLMDSFYAVIPLKRKTRVHFHEFMRDVHRALDEEKNVENPLDIVAAKIARRFRLICFDEFHVSDIADAMILYNLMQALFDRGVCFVITSNYQPDGLYPDGLHRDRMLPAIELLKSKLDVLNVDGGIDYRRRVMQQVAAYKTPLGPAATSALLHAFVSIAEAGEEDPRITIESREIRCVRRAGGVIWFDFATLCGGPRSQNDFLEIASQFHTVFLSGVPHMKVSMASEARRFTWLIDVLYDRRVKLVVMADLAPEDLYTEGPMSHEFPRTASRLREMQSGAFLALGRRMVDTSLT